MLKKLFKFGGDSDFGKKNNLIIGVAGLVLTLILWYLISIFGIIPPKILPNPIKVIGSIGGLFSEYHLISNIWFTLKMNWEAYFFALLISFPVGFLIGTIPFMNIFIGRYIAALRFIPCPVLTPIFISAVGLTFGCKVSFLTFAITIFMIPEIVNTINNLQNPNNVKDNVYLQTIDTLGANNWQKFRYVYWPYVTSNVYTTLVSLMGISFSYVTISELIYKDGDVNGMGALINTMIRQSYMAEAYMLIFLIVLIGFLQDKVLMLVGKKLFPYKFSE